MGPSLDQPQHAKLCCGPPCSVKSQNMLHLAQQLALFPSILQPNRMAWLGRARGPSSHSGQTVQMLLWQFRTGLTSWASPTEPVGIAFAWHTKGSAGCGRRLNSAWRPDVNGLAIQTQMAQRPRHQCQGLLPPSTVMSKPLQHHCQQELFRSHRVSGTWAFQARPKHTHQRCQPPPLKPSGRKGRAKFSAQGM